MTSKNFTRSQHIDQEDVLIPDQSFTQLTDTPADYTGMAGMTATVNPTEDGLIFAAATSGSAFNMPVFHAPYGKLMNKTASATRNIANAAAFWSTNTFNSSGSYPWAGAFKATTANNEVVFDTITGSGTLTHLIGAEGDGISTTTFTVIADGVEYIFSESAGTGRLVIGGFAPYLPIIAGESYFIGTGGFYDVGFQTTQNAYMYTPAIAVSNGIGIQFKESLIIKVLCTVTEPANYRYNSGFLYQRGLLAEV